VGLYCLAAHKVGRRAYNADADWAHPIHPRTMMRLSEFIITSLTFEHPEAVKHSGR